MWWKGKFCTDEHCNLVGYLAPGPLSMHPSGRNLVAPMNHRLVDMDHNFRSESASETPAYFHSSCRTESYRVKSRILEVWLIRSASLVAVNTVLPQMHRYAPLECIMKRRDGWLGETWIISSLCITYLVIFSGKLHQKRYHKPGEFGNL